MGRPRGTGLSADLSKKLAEGVERLGLTQTEIAHQSGLAQATISKFLRGQPIDRGNALQILDTLAHVELPFELLELVRVELGVERDRLLPRPALAGTLDRALRKHLTSIEITGGPLVGKTTLAATTLATKQQEFVLLELDGNLCFDREGDHNRECEALTRLFVHQARSLLGLDARDPPSDLNDLAFWFKRERTRTTITKPLCLFADNVSLLQDETITRLHGLIRNFHNHRQVLQCNQVIVRSPASARQSDFLAESSAMFEHHVHVDWLTSSEVTELVDALLDTPRSDLSSKIFTELGGQPQLTHALVMRLADGLELDAALESMHTEGACETFTKRISKLTTPAQRAVLLGEPESDRASMRYLCQLGLAEHRNGFELRVHADTLLQRLLRSLDEGAP